MTDSSPFQLWRDDIAAAARLLTRLPLGTAHEADPSRAVRAYPLIGGLVGVIGGGTFWLASTLGLPVSVAALFALAATILITGALHEDGLADTADGFGGGQDRDHKLSIMRDSRIGSFGVLALILSVGLRAMALAAIGAPGAVLAALVAAHSLARAMLPAIMALLPLARQDGLAVATGRPAGRHVWTGLAIALVIAVIAVDGGDALLVLLLAAGAALAVGLLARAQIGGYSGDVLGAAAQAAETAVLVGLAAS